MAAQPDFSVSSEIKQLDVGLSEGESYVVQVTGDGDVQYTNAADAATAATRSWKTCLRLAFFTFTVDSTDPIFVRSLNQNSVLAISDG